MLDSDDINLSARGKLHEVTCHHSFPEINYSFLGLLESIVTEVIATIGYPALVQVLFEFLLLLDSPSCLYEIPSSSMAVTYRFIY